MISNTCKFRENLQSFYKFLRKDLVKVMFSFFPLHSLVGYIVFFSSVFKAFCKIDAFYFVAHKIH
jgi:hypothetical protein